MLSLPRILNVLKRVISLWGILCSSIAMAEMPETGFSAIKVLIVDGFSNHHWQQTTQIIKTQLEASGRFSVEVSTAPPTKESLGWDEWPWARGVC